MNDIQMARVLGLLSLGLGAAEIAMPRCVSHELGLEKPHVVEAFGGREILNGLLALGYPDRAWPIWARVGGDVLDRVKQTAFLGTDRPHVLRQAINNCRNFGIVSIIGVYGGLIDKVPMGSAINRGLTFRMAQTPVQRYLRPLLERVEKGEIDPSFVITHVGGLEDGPDLYRVFRDKKDQCVKVMLKP